MSPHSTLSREAQADLEIGQTAISPRMSGLLCTLFCATIVVVPLAQAAIDGLRPANGDGPRRLRVLEIFRTLPSVHTAWADAHGTALDKVFAANAQLRSSTHQYETTLEDDGWLTELCLGPTQSVLTGWLGAGNEQVYPGRSGWLYYRPDVDYLTGPGFLEDRALARFRKRGGDPRPLPNAASDRIAGGADVSRQKPGGVTRNPDPRPAILSFHRQLASRGIRLIVLPVPVKPLVEPTALLRGGRTVVQDLQNASYAQLIQELEQAGVEVCDITQQLSRSRLADRPQYLATDTHWTPAAIEEAAAALRMQIDRSMPGGPAHPPDAYPTATQLVRNLGDTAALLRLPAHSQLFAPESVQIVQVLSPDGKLWQPDKSASILLLGDSFTNIYSQVELGWGTSAGLAEQLSRQLKRPIDRLAQNDNGAFATRLALSQDLARGRDRLAGKKIVIWEFSMRELSSGDWRVVPPGPGAPVSRPDSQAASADSILVQGTIAGAGQMPVPGTVPYRDGLIALHLVDVSISGLPSPDREMTVYTWGMRDNRLTSEARLPRGAKVQFRLTLWNTAEGRYGRIARAELDDPDFTLVDLPVYWGERVK